MRRREWSRGVLLHAPPRMAYACGRRVTDVLQEETVGVLAIARIVANTEVSALVAAHVTAV